MNIQAKEKCGARVFLALLTDLQFSRVGETGLSSHAKQEREWAMKGIMPAELSWSTGRNTLTSDWNSSAMDISQQGTLCKVSVHLGGRVSEEAVEISSS